MGDQGPQLEAVKPLLDDFRPAAGTLAPRSLGFGDSGASKAIRFEDNRPHFATFGM